MKTEEEIKKEAQELWKQLGDIPIDENEFIEEEWHIFPKGTDRMEIWHWFEEYFNLSIAKDLR